MMLYQSTIETSKSDLKKNKKSNAFIEKINGIFKNSALYLSQKICIQMLFGLIFIILVMILSYFKLFMINVILSFVIIFVTFGFYLYISNSTAVTSEEDIIFGKVFKDKTSDDLSGFLVIAMLVTIVFAIYTMIFSYFNEMISSYINLSILNIVISLLFLCGYIGMFVFIQHASKEDIDKLI